MGERERERERGVKGLVRNQEAGLAQVLGINSVVRVPRRAGYV